MRMITKRQLSYMAVDASKKLVVIPKGSVVEILLVDDLSPTDRVHFRRRVKQRRATGNKGRLVAFMWAGGIRFVRYTDLQKEAGP